MQFEQKATDLKVLASANVFDDFPFILAVQCPPERSGQERSHHLYRPIRWDKFNDLVGDYDFHVNVGKIHKRLNYTYIMNIEIDCLGI